MPEPNEHESPDPGSGPIPPPPSYPTYPPDPLPPAEPPPNARNGSATASLVLGLLSLVTGPLTGLPALLFAVIALNRHGQRARASVGLLLGVVGAFVMPVVGYLFLFPRAERLYEGRKPVKDLASLNQVGKGLQKYTGTDEASTNRPGDWMAWQQKVFPSASDGLSWRVQLLPSLNQAGLHGRFKQNQPWDSPANLPLAGERVKEYVSALDPQTTTETHYRVFVTEPGSMDKDASLFYAPRPDGRAWVVPLVRITDGTSNTIFAVEAAETVPWPQPKELAYGANVPLPALGHPDRAGVFLVLMCDGSARAIKKDIPEKTLRALITPRGEETLGDW